MGDILEILLRVGISILVLLVLARIDGPKQISQLTYYDYIVGITVGSIAGALCVDIDINIYHGIIGIVLFMLSSMFLSWLTNKSIIARRVVTGLPIFLIAKGEVMFEGLKHARFDMNDLLRELRSQGYFDISEINYAILEPNGCVSVMPKAYARPPKVSDMALKIQEDTIMANVVIDGKIISGNLNAMNKDKNWLEGELKKQNVVRLKDVALATLDEEGSLCVYFKNRETSRRTTLI